MTIGLEGFRVRCQSCRLVMYETTKFYNCHIPLTGDMLKLLPLYKDWPCYDGSLASRGTTRFLMFCSQCASYITSDGKLEFADFPDMKVTEISEERSRLCWRDSPKPSYPVEGPVVLEVEGPVVLEVEGPVVLEVEGPVVLEVEGPVVLEPEQGSKMRKLVDALIVDEGANYLTTVREEPEVQTCTPTELMEKIDKRARTSRKKKRK